MSDPNSDYPNQEPNGSSSTSSSSAPPSDYELINDTPQPSPGNSESKSQPCFLSDGDSKGRPIQIVKVTNERKFELDVEALESILLRDSIRDTPVVVVSIAGDFRKGKSFMLNHFLRYLQHSSNDSSKDGESTDWLSDPKAPLLGFSWRGGCQRDTTGILMWSEPFIIKNEKGKDVAVILMDTQGAFDSEYTVKDSATVFALSTMTSSIQVFNIMHNLQEDNLQVLEIFLDYGRLALESVHEKPFQKLIFLIRDWSYPYEHEYGFEGGTKLLEKKLELKETMPEQLQRVRRKIRECFREIGCFLMPHPGSKVATAANFDGRIEDYDNQFLKNLQFFVPNLFEPSKVIPKEIGGRPITGRQLLEYFKVYINVFAGDTMPEPKTMLEATAEANNLTAVALVKEMYDLEMEGICGGNQPYMNPTILEQRHNELMAKCLDEFDTIPKMGGQEFSVPYREQLEEKLSQAFEHYAIQNKSKNVFGLLGTPLILLGACFLMFISARIIELFGIVKLANIFVSIGTMDLALFVFYVVGRFTGNYPHVISLIDSYSEEIWIFVLDKLQGAIQAQTIGAVTGGSNSTITRTFSSGGNGTSSGNSTSTHQINVTYSSPSSSTNLSRHNATELHKRR